MRDFFAQLGWKLILEFVKYALLAIGGLLFSYFTPEILGKIYPILASYKWPLILILACFSLAIIIGSYYRLNKHVPHFPKIDFSYSFLKREVSYQYKSRTHIEHAVNTQLLALKNGVDHLPMRFNWTGSSFTITSRKKEQDIITLPQTTTYTEYQVKFDRMLRKSDVIDTALLIQLIDLE